MGREDEDAKGREAVVSRNEDKTWTCCGHEHTERYCGRTGEDNGGWECICYEPSKALPAKVSAESACSFFVALDKFLRPLKDAKLPDETVQRMIEAWIRGYAAGVEQR
jgi:hypothetical protein